MKRLKTKPHCTDKELKAILSEQTDIPAYRNWQIIYLVQTNQEKTTEEIARFLGISKSKIYSVVKQFNKHGKAWRNDKTWGGRREARCLFSLEEEALILKEIEKDAISGSILTYKQVKTIIEKKANKAVSDDYIWDLFKRHGWKKKSPRKSHPKKDEQAQEEYKKNLKKIWLPSH